MTTNKNQTKSIPEELTNSDKILSKNKVKSTSSQVAMKNSIRGVPLSRLNQEKNRVQKKFQLLKNLLKRR
jgi:hypothetical protein